MRKLILIILVSMLISSVAAASDKTNSLILLTAKSLAETEEAIKLIEYFGGEVRHVFLPDVLNSKLPQKTNCFIYPDLNLPDESGNYKFLPTR